MIRGSDGITVRNIGGQSSLSVMAPEDESHPFRVTAHREVDGETVKWWLGIEPGFARCSISSFMGMSDGSGNVIVGSLSVSADDLANVQHVRDYSITKVNCYKEMRGAVNDLKKTQYLADGESLVFAYAQNPGFGNPKLGVTSLSVFNTYFSTGIGGYSANPIIGILSGGGTIWRRVCLNIMPIAYFDGAGKVKQYCRDTLDMILPSETAWLGSIPAGMTEQEYFDAQVNYKWGAYTFETDASGAPAGYTFDSDV